MFVTAHDARPDSGLGTGGEALHTWAFFAAGAVEGDPEMSAMIRVVPGQT